MAGLMGAAEGIKPLYLSDRQPMVGQTVIAFGNPKGLGISVFEGIVSGLDRDLGFGVFPSIQTDIAAPPEGSGPLTDEEG